MSYSTGKEGVPKLWAIVGGDGKVRWSRGGSSTAPRLMVYPSYEAAEKALKNPWTKQVIPDTSMVCIRCIYNVAEWEGA